MNKALGGLYIFFCALLLWALRVKSNEIEMEEL